MKKVRSFIVCISMLQLIAQLSAYAESGYRLWLRYDLVSDETKLTTYKQLIKNWHVEGDSPTHGIIRKELQAALSGLLGNPIASSPSILPGTLFIGTSLASKFPELNLTDKIESIGREGYLILSTTISKKKVIVITAQHEAGLLYGSFHFLRLLQTAQDIGALNVKSSPKIKLRVLNHWDNLDRTVERGYAGFSLWDWHRLPDYIDPRYHDYARANASIGINGSVLTNVNANSLVLTPPYLEKVAALANVFRPYGIKVYLTARFSAPIEIGGLKTADPLNPEVRRWWNEKVDEIYRLIPDFGGFLVKANSEGQPGPQNYGRTHADGANLLADALHPHGGVVMWRAFVYDNNVPEDRAKQAHTEFKPLDGKFRDNVLVQVKNGPIDFQPREPFHPLFGATPQTPLMMEFQITQEYLGFSTHLVFLPTLFKECLDADTYGKGQGTTVARVIDGSVDHHAISGMAGVANIGNDLNWCGHPFAQANWFGFGRLAWDHTFGVDQLAEEWIRMTFSNDPAFVKPVKSMMLSSHETAVNYMTPLGLHHIMGWSHHYGPAPWIRDKHRADWTSVYYHRADSIGLGFNRSPSGSQAIAQYQSPLRELWANPETCPEKYLLWFHHVAWDRPMKSGMTLWNELCHRYYRAAEEVKEMQNTWASQRSRIDKERFEQVEDLLAIQQKEAIWWRNACVLYFQTFSKQPIPTGLEKPDKTLDYYEKLAYPFAPGIRPQW